MQRGVDCLPLLFLAVRIDKIIKLSVEIGFDTNSCNRVIESDQLICYYHQLFQLS